MYARVCLDPRVSFASLAGVSDIAQKPTRKKGGGWGDFFAVLSEKGGRGSGSRREGWWTNAAARAVM